MAPQQIFGRLAKAVHSRMPSLQKCKATTPMNLSLELNLHGAVDGNIQVVIHEGGIL